MSAHTPGPWMLANHKQWIVDSGVRTIAKMEAFDGFETDARLIAAAPELLAACKKALNSLDLDLQAMATLEQAIAKAEGPAVESSKIHEHGDVL